MAMGDQLISTSLDPQSDQNGTAVATAGEDDAAGAVYAGEGDNPMENQAMDPAQAPLAPQRPRVAPRIVTPQNVYIMDSILRDIIQRGTGRRAKQLGRNDIAGKTGTTNDQRDAWFSGFNPDVVTTAWVGFDNPKTLGERETGGRAALPMWIYYMREALKGLPEKPIKRPPGLVTVRIDPDTGLLANAGSPNAIFETFREEHVPQRMVEESVNADLTGSSGGGVPGEEIPEQLF
jgi:penicillin-binding protein 1A